VNVNVWLAPLPDDGDTDTACGALALGAVAVHVPIECHPEEPFASVAIP
jgi:hypothetical protein